MKLIGLFLTLVIVDLVVASFGRKINGDKNFYKNNNDFLEAFLYDSIGICYVIATVACGWQSAITMAFAFITTDIMLWLFDYTKKEKEN